MRKTTDKLQPFVHDGLACVSKSSCLRPYWLFGRTLRVKHQHMCVLNTDVFRHFVTVNMPKKDAEKYETPWCKPVSPDFLSRLCRPLSPSELRVPDLRQRWTASTDSEVCRFCPLSDKRRSFILKGQTECIHLVLHLLTHRAAKIQIPLEMSQAKPVTYYSSVSAVHLLRRALFLVF